MVQRILTTLTGRNIFLDHRIYRCFHYHPRINKIDKDKITQKINMMQAINQALDDTLKNIPNSLIFGEDVSFGGVFRCTVDLKDKYGEHRVFNTPISEQSLIGFAIGTAVAGLTTVAEIQFADYIFPAFDQLINEAAKLRYRSGGTYNCGKMVVRAPCGIVGHGGHYHSQCVEQFFMSVPGLKVVVPRGPFEAKGLLNQCIIDNNPVLFFEPKILYRHAVDDVPTDFYTLPIESAEIVKHGDNITIVAWGAMVHRVLDAVNIVEKQTNLSCEIIDLQTILPWDENTIVKSVKKTHRLVVVHESSITGGCAAEIAATVQSDAFNYLEAPISRICGLDVHIPVTNECFVVPHIPRIVDEITYTLIYE